MGCTQLTVDTAVAWFIFSSSVNIIIIIVASILLHSCQVFHPMSVMCLLKSTQLFYTRFQASSIAGQCRFHTDRNGRCLVSHTMSKCWNRWSNWWIAILTSTGGPAMNVLGPMHELTHTWGDQVTIVTVIVLWVIINLKIKWIKK